MTAWWNDRSRMTGKARCRGCKWVPVRKQWRWIYFASPHKYSLLHKLITHTFHFVWSFELAGCYMPHMWADLELNRFWTCGNLGLQLSESSGSAAEIRKIPKETNYVLTFSEEKRGNQIKSLGLISFTGRKTFLHWYMYNLLVCNFDVW